MDTTFGGPYHDFKLGLRCKYEIANGNFEEALGLLNRLRQKDRPIDAALRYRALQGKLARDGDQSGELSIQLEKLRSTLADFDMDSLVSELGWIPLRRG
jgi:hypothetical protein